MYRVSRGDCRGEGQETPTHYTKDLRTFPPPTPESGEQIVPKSQHSVVRTIERSIPRTSFSFSPWLLSGVKPKYSARCAFWNSTGVLLTRSFGNILSRKGGNHSSRNEVSRPRSEERRVGKECRSRWKPY